MARRWFDGGSRKPREVNWNRHVRDDLERGDNTLVMLAVLNVVVFGMWSFAIGGAGSAAQQQFMYEHFLVSAPAVFSGRVWTLVTSVFSHYDLWHLAFNMIGLAVFGRTVAHQLGTRTLVNLYLVGGVVASLAHVAFNLFMGGGGALGASGAIMALAVVYALCNPNAQLAIYFLIPVPARVAVFGFLLLDVLGLVGPANGIANAAHLGGAAYGALYWYLFLRPPSRPKVKPGTYGTRL